MVKVGEFKDGVLAVQLPLHLGVCHSIASFEMCILGYAQLLQHESEFNYYSTGVDAENLVTKD